MTTTPAAILLLSGGLDSYTAGAIVKGEGFRLCALTIRYGQTHPQEIDASRRAAAALGVERHVELDLDLRDIARSALTGASAVPLDRDVAAAHDIPSTYVPARNTIFLSLALAWAETVGASDIVIGVNALDYSGYPDCRPAFVEAFERMANLATKMTTEEGASSRPFKVHAPLVHLTKAQIIRRGVELGVDYGMTHSCYDPDAHGRACGRCDSCLLRKKGFVEAGVSDPTAYAPL
jgi:7-cyano-7-deazaguanine synthase